MTIAVSPSSLADATPVARRPKIVVARGDGIGPEIMDACLRILAAAGADLDLTEIAIGEAVYLSGHSSGISPDS